MIEPSWAAEPFAAHVSATEKIAKTLAAGARAAGASVIRLDLAGVHDREELSTRLAEVFRYPHETRGLDASVDLMSDLTWLGATRGHLLIIDVSGATGQVVAAFAGIVPAIVDRWRAQGIPFVAVFHGAKHVEAATLALEGANLRLREAGELPWAQPGTGPVAIFADAPER